jgi:hypothetical protein
VLGKRWVYDGTADPVYAAALASAVLGHTGQAEELVEGVERRAPSMDIASTAPGDAVVPVVSEVVRVTGEDTVVIVTDTVELTVARRPGAELTGAVLTGTWPGLETPVALASAR